MVPGPHERPTRVRAHRGTHTRSDRPETGRPTCAATAGTRNAWSRKSTGGATGASYSVRSGSWSQGTTSRGRPGPSGTPWPWNAGAMSPPAARPRDSTPRVHDFAAEDVQGRATLGDAQSGKDGPRPPAAQPCAPQGRFVVTVPIRRAAGRGPGPRGGTTDGTSDLQAYSPGPVPRPGTQKTLYSGYPTTERVETGRHEDSSQDPGTDLHPTVVYRKAGYGPRRTQSESCRRGPVRLEEHPSLGVERRTLTG